MHKKRNLPIYSQTAVNRTEAWFKGHYAIWQGNRSGLLHSYWAAQAAPCLVTSRPLRKIFPAALSPPPSLVAFSFKSYCDKTTGI